MYKCINEGDQIRVKFTYQFYNQYPFLLSTERGVEITGYGLLSAQEVKRVVRDFLSQRKARWLVETIMDNELKVKNDEFIRDHIQDALQLFEELATAVEIKNQEKKQNVDVHGLQMEEVNTFGPYRPVPIFVNTSNHPEYHGMNKTKRKTFSFMKSPIMMGLYVSLSLLVGVIMGRLSFVPSKTVSGLEMQVKKMRSTIEALSEERGGLELEAAKLKQDKKMLLGKLDLELKTSQPIKEEVEYLRDEKEEHVSKAFKYQQDLVVFEKENEKLKQALLLSEQKLEESLEQIQQQNSDYEVLNNRFSGQQKELETLSEDYNLAKKNLQDTYATLGHLKEEYKQQKEVLDELNEELLRYKKDNMVLEKAVKEAQQDVVKLQKSKQQVDQELLHQKEEKESLWDESVELNKQLRQRTLALKNTEKKLFTMQEKVKCYINTQIWTLSSPEEAWRSYCVKNGIALDNEGYIMNISR
ncbi:hypothetical protein [Algivirga pacifica]|uniref:Uncharacterized protein n=1 Tax=Algivirga pacifica TaxID=1162670 RepID=A0ABP9DHK0_9BACT